MSTSVLQFSLGLSTSAFNSAVTKAGEHLHKFSEKAFEGNFLNKSLGDLTGKFLSLGEIGATIGASIASFSSLQSIVEGVFGAIEKGAALEQLSKRTDTSVASLYQLQKGFQTVGLSADQVGPMVLRMQKSLGGVNESGADTKNVFYRMGLSLEDLKKMDAPGQFKTISTALGKLNNSSAINAASAIFGREGAGNMMQLSRSTGEFSDAMEKARHDAQLFQRNAETFEHLDQTLVQIKQKTETLFAGMAEGAAPAIQMIEDGLNSIDLTKLGEKIGKVFLAFTEAFREGKLMELIVLSVKTGFEVGLSFVPGIFEKLGAFLLKLFETPLMYVQAFLTWLELKMGEWLDKFESSLPKVVQKAVGYNPDNVMHGMNQQGGAPTFAEVYKDRQAEGLQLGGLDQSNQIGTDDMSQDADARIAAAIKQMGVIVGPLVATITGLDDRAPKPRAGVVKNSDGSKEGGGSSKGEETHPSSPSQYKPEHTSFEKMGFVMGGASSPLLEATKQQTTAMVKLTAAINKMTPAQKAGVSVGVNLAINQAINLL